MRTSPAIVVVAAVMLLAAAAGCSNGPAAPSGVRTTTSPSAADMSPLPPATVTPVYPPARRSDRDPEEQAAVRMALRGLDTLELPPGSVPTAGSPVQALASPPYQEATANLIDRARWWTVPASFADTSAWLSSHPPAGTSKDQSGSGTHGGTVVSSYTSYRLPSKDQLVKGQLIVSVATNGQGSVIRADGQATWLTAHPTPYPPAKHRLRVTLATGCPVALGNRTDVDNAPAGLTHQMLPTGRVTGGLVCRYGDGSGHPQRLASRIRLDTSTATPLVAAIRALRLGVTPGAGGCPSDTGQVTVIVLGLSGRADVDLWQHASGCQSLDNGYQIAEETGNPSFYEGFMTAIGKVR